MEKKRMPVLFVGHGSPMNAIGENRSRPTWREMGARLGKPEVIIAVSAHWMTHGLCVRRSETNPQVNDMYGFPDELYAVKYAPISSIETADKVMAALGDGVRVANDWGIDHGVWTVLCNMYPDADVPVVMVSTDVDASPEAQFETGRRLASLRDEGAMIVASGNVVHNLRMVNWRMRGGFDWADTFDETVKLHILAGDYDKIVGYESIADHDLAVPTTEHFFPLLTALGAVREGDRCEVWNEYRELGSMSMTSYLFQ